jgi:hypothetical protein
MTSFSKYLETKFESTITYKSNRLLNDIEEKLLDIDVKVVDEAIRLVEEGKKIGDTTNSDMLLKILKILRNKK